ncbi:RNI-like protein [Jaminaea rosea]|uniref:RNI-like protein n=1 Tax=Jaminaea rosea TaxID=1569628 RepID=A0A316UHT6_9BASI|nr:RNI-like protein [Jaminaea rosea]PWN24856.1 RNI-like protein [Jaminaea rosea]
MSTSSSASSSIASDAKDVKDARLDEQEDAIAGPSTSASTSRGAGTSWDDAQSQPHPQARLGDDGQQPGKEEEGENLSDAAPSSSPSPRSVPLRTAPQASSSSSPSSSPSPSSPPLLPPKQSPHPHHTRRRRPRPPTRSILKPSPSPSAAKPFSFRRDIIENLNTRLALQGVNVQVPLPPPGMGMGSAGVLGGMIKRAVGAAGAAWSGTTGGVEAGMQQRGAGLGGERPGATQSAGGSSSSSLLSTTSPQQPPAPSSPSTQLRRVQFHVSSLRVVYPISSSLPPLSESPTKQRIEAQHRQSLASRRSTPWTPTELQDLYISCCRAREEVPLPAILSLLVAQNPLKSLDLSLHPLAPHSLLPICDLLSVPLPTLQKLTLDHCGLTDATLLLVLHALLVSGTVGSLSIAGNRKVGVRGWRGVGEFLARMKGLKGLDLSECPLGRGGVEGVVAGLRRGGGEEKVTRNGDARPPGNGKGVGEEKDRERDEQRNADPEANPHAEQHKVNGSHDSYAPRVSTQKPRNSDEHGDHAEHADSDSDSDSDSASASSSSSSSNAEPLMPPAPLLRSSSSGSGYGGDGSNLTSLRLENCSLRSGPTLALLAEGVRHSALKHISLRRNRIGPQGAAGLAAILVDWGEDKEKEGKVESVELGSPQGGGEINHAEPGPALSGKLGVNALANGSASDPSKPNLPHPHAAPRPPLSLSPLLTLDLKTNSLSTGGLLHLLPYLRRNKTLRVLNLSDNSIDSSGLLGLAEVLGENTTLETLDMSHNPCCGPEGEAVRALGRALKRGKGLKRLFLNSTNLSTPSCLLLASALPAARSLLHLDLTQNPSIDIEGILSLARGLEGNRTIRCLDVEVTPGDERGMEISREILMACIRNTRLAQKRATSRGLTAPVAAPIYSSTIARVAKEKEEQEQEQQRERASAIATASARKITRNSQQGGGEEEENEALLRAAKECGDFLLEVLEGKRGAIDPATATATASAGDDELLQDLVAQSRRLSKQLSRLIEAQRQNDTGHRGAAAADPPGLIDEDAQQGQDTTTTTTTTKRVQDDPTTLLHRALLAQERLVGITGELVASFASREKKQMEPQQQREEREGRDDSSGKDVASSGVGEDGDGERGAGSSSSARLAERGREQEEDQDEDQQERNSDSEPQGSGRPSAVLSSSPSQVASLEHAEAEQEGSVPLHAHAHGHAHGHTAEEERARDMVDEEGEVFRKARAMLLREDSESPAHSRLEDFDSEDQPTGQEGEERDTRPPIRRGEEDEQSKEKQESPTPPGAAEGKGRRRSASSGSGSEQEWQRDREDPAAEAEAAAAAAESASREADALAEVGTSGDELRRQLLLTARPEEGVRQGD